MSTKDNGVMERLAKSQNQEVWEFEMWAEIDLIFGFGYSLKPSSRAEHAEDMKRSANKLGKIIAEQIIAMNGRDALATALTGWDRRRAGKRTLKGGPAPSPKTLQVDAALTIYLAYWRNEHFSKLDRHQAKPTQKELLDFINGMPQRKGLKKLTKQDVSDALKKLGREDELDNGQLGTTKAKRSKSAKVS